MWCMWHELWYELWLIKEQKLNVAFFDMALFMSYLVQVKGGNKIFERVANNGYDNLLANQQVITF